jgi:hypothetical protein
MTGFYFDEHMNRAVADGLMLRGYFVIMAVDVEMEGKDDDTEHLAFAFERHLVMVTFDHPFAVRTLARTDHTGLICLAYRIRENIGRMIEVLVEFAQLYEPDRDSGQVFWLSEYSLSLHFSPVLFYPSPPTCGRFSLPALQTEEKST